MKQKLVRINSIDGIELPGILYNPIKDTKRIIIHVHGLSGSFYENKFLDILAQTYTDKDYAFLTFNNRGTGFISELIKENDFQTIGGCFERFEDCILDIQGIVNWVKEKGYSEIILQGHSYGCNKVLYYYSQSKSENIKKLILLAPCDIPSECIKFLSKEEYETAKKTSTKLVKEGKEKELIDFSVMANGKIAAGTYYYNFLPGGVNDFIKYVDGVNGKSKVLNSIDIPVLIVFGDIDECVLTEPIEVVQEYLKNNIKDSNVQVIRGANHSYINCFEELGKVVEKYI